MPCSHVQNTQLPLYVIPQRNYRPPSPPPSYDHDRETTVFSPCVMFLLVFVNVLALVIVVVAICGLSFEISKENITCRRAEALTDDYHQS